MRATRSVVFALALFLSVAAFAQHRASDVAGGSAAVTPASTAKVVDAKGVVVGPILGFHFTGALITLVKLPNGDSVPLMIANPRSSIYNNQDLARTWSRGSFAYTSGNCTGTPLASPAFSALALFKRFGVVGPPGNTLYISEPFAAAVAMTISSSRGFDDNCNGYPPSSGGMWIPLTPLLDLDTLFTPPFHVE